MWLFFKIAPLVDINNTSGRFLLWSSFIFTSVTEVEVIKTTTIWLYSQKEKTPKFNLSSTTSVFSLYWLSCIKRATLETTELQPDKAPWKYSLSSSRGRKTKTTCGGTSSHCSQNSGNFYLNVWTTNTEEKSCSGSHRVKDILEEPLSMWDCQVENGLNRSDIKF